MTKMVRRKMTAELSCWLYVTSCSKLLMAMSNIVFSYVRLSTTGINSIILLSIGSYLLGNKMIA